jgi:succinyl-CoA synthetase beta subunit
MQCDVIANGIVGASKQLGIEVPVVVRLEGTNVEKGKEIIANSGLKLIPALNMEDGARKVVEAAGLA